MGSLTLTTTALKRVNAGGGFNPRKRQNDTGSDYIVFNCPGSKCGRRNKQSLYESVYTTPEKTVAFKCKMCRTTVEVTLPISDRKIPMIVSPDQYANTRAALRKDLPSERGLILGR